MTVFSATTVAARAAASASASASSYLSRIVLLIRNGRDGSGSGLARSVNFYHEALQLPVLRVTDTWAELLANQNVILSLQVVQEGGGTGTESQLCTGYSPWLTFNVENMDQTIANCVQAGGHLDGPIQYPAYGKIALLRTPDNFMLGLYEPATPVATATTTTTTPSSASEKTTTATKTNTTTNTTTTPEKQTATTDGKTSTTGTTTTTSDEKK